MRRLLLIIAPLPTVAASIALATWARYDPHDGATRNVVCRDAFGEDRSVLPPDPADAAPLCAPHEVSAFDDLQQACQRTGRSLKARLPDDCVVLVRAPLVLAGDMSEAQLQHVYERTIHPAIQAMQHSYFDTVPSEPVTVLLFSHEGTYTRYAEKLFGQKNISIYGYYKPASRTLILNLGTGSGTLVHELTHALIDFDFPKVPVWFNEGLASLHEQCRFVENQEREKSIEGLVNWRLPILQQAIEQGTLGSLQALTSTSEFLGANEAVNYAQARYLCMYLQQRGLLTKFYRQFRDNAPSDPQGTATLKSLFPNQEWSEIDRQFQGWAGQLQR